LHPAPSLITERHTMKAISDPSIVAGEVKAVHAALFPASFAAPRADEIEIALKVYEMALKIEGLSEIKSVLGELAPLVVSFIDGLKEAVEQDKAAKKSAAR
jgi:hypothetical protein